MPGDIYLAGLTKTHRSQTDVGPAPQHATLHYHQTKDLLDCETLNTSTVPTLKLPFEVFLNTNYYICAHDITILAGDLNTIYF